MKRQVVIVNKGKDKDQNSFEFILHGVDAEELSAQFFRNNAELSFKSSSNSKDETKKSFANASEKKFGSIGSVGPSKTLSLGKKSQDVQKESFTDRSGYKVKLFMRFRERIEKIGG